MNKKIITVTVKPNSKKIGIEKNSDNQYIVRVNQPPVDGKANEAVIELLSEFFDLPKSKIKIIKGEKSKTKLIELLVQ